MADCRLTLVLLAVVSTFQLASSQSCSGTPGECIDTGALDCSQVTQVSMCRGDVKRECCSTCAGIAQCRDCATNCDSFSSWQCYEPFIREEECCLTCMANRTEQFGLDFCNYGDMADACNQGPGRCDESVYASVCCATCFTGDSTGTTPPACVDDESFDCASQRDSSCYSTTFSQLCCSKCKAAADLLQPINCWYGDRASDDECDMVTPGECNAFEQEQCCRSCQEQTESPLCSMLVSEPSICYSVEDTCPVTCEGLVQDYPAELDCKYGDKVVGELSCNANTNCEVNSGTCCATCYDPPPACMDMEGECEQLFLDTDQFRYRCYDPDVYSMCCEICTAEATGPEGCRWGDQDTLCRISGVSQCNQPVIRDNCCDLCQDSILTPGTTSATSTTVAPPVCIEDMSDLCVVLVRSPSDCYSTVPGRLSFLEMECCKTCESHVNPNLPAACKYGNRMEYCERITEDEARDTCESNPNFKADCCETCYNVRPCSNQWTDESCRNIYNSLGGECSENVQSVCCNTCTYGVSTTTTTPSTTTPTPCPDNLGTEQCVNVIMNEGEVSCYTPFMQEWCCGACGPYVTTEAPPSTTPGPVCDGDQLSSCAQLDNSLENLCGDSALRALCCEYCGDIIVTTRPPANCPNGDLWSESLCSAVYKNAAVSGNPCETVTSLQDNCCLYCYNVAGTTTPSITTTTTPMTTTTPSCTEDSGVIDCAAAYQDDQSLCSSSAADLCCAFCRDIAECTENEQTQEFCEGLVGSYDSKEEACSEVYVRQRCCLYCQTPAECTENEATEQFCETLVASYDSKEEACYEGYVQQRCCLFCQTAVLCTPTDNEQSLDFCQFLADSYDSNEVACADEYVKERCCLFCEHQSITTTTTMTPEPGCDSDQISTCDQLYIDTDFTLCTTSAFKDACCFFCRTAVTTTPPPPDVDGGWSDWEYLPCSVSCGGGSRTRTRLCNDPEPSGNGANCEGSNTETTDDCGNDPCPGDCANEWTDSECDRVVVTDLCPTYVAQCACSCSAFTSSTSTTTTTVMTTTTEACVDNNDQCAELDDEIGGNDVCASPNLGSQCCAYCRARPECVYDNDGQDLSYCVGRNASSGDACDFEAGYAAGCCIFCGRAEAPSARKRRSAEEILVEREKRQVSTVDNWSTDLCAQMAIDNGQDPNVACDNDAELIANCYNYCQEISANPYGKSNQGKDGHLPMSSVKEISNQPAIENPEQSKPTDKDLVSPSENGVYKMLVKLEELVLPKN